MAFGIIEPIERSMDSGAYVWRNDKPNLPALSRTRYLLVESYHAFIRYLGWPLEIRNAPMIQRVTNIVAEYSPKSAMRLLKSSEEEEIP
jgi:hypothetical protein